MDVTSSMGSTIRSELTGARKKVPANPIAPDLMAPPRPAAWSMLGVSETFAACAPAAVAAVAAMIVRTMSKFRVKAKTETCGGVLELASSWEGDVSKGGDDRWQADTLFLE